MTDMKMQYIDLSAKIVIYKQKAKGYKQKLKEELEAFKAHHLDN